MLEEKNQTPATIKWCIEVIYKFAEVFSANIATEVNTILFALEPLKSAKSKPVRDAA